MWLTALAPFDGVILFSEHTTAYELFLSPVGQNLGLVPIPWEGGQMV